MYKHKHHGSVRFSFLALSGFVAALVCLSPALARGQIVVGTINSPAATKWISMALYQTGGKLFIADNTNAQILVYDANSLGYLNTISLSSFLPSRPQTMAVHDGTGTLYVAVSTGMATSDSTIVIINAATNSIVDTITNIGWDVALGIDESRARLYTLGYISFAGQTLTAIDCTTNGIVGSLNITSLMGLGLLVRSTDTWLNPLTGELVIGNLHYDKFVVVNGPAMTGELISATDSRGWTCAWNPQENKIYIATADWNGYFIYDRDTKTSTTTSCINDADRLSYSQATNRIYTGAEVNGKATVIEGATDACQNVYVAPGLSVVGFITATHHAYFVDPSSIKVLDENTLTVVDTISNCNPSAYGGTDSQVIVNQAKGWVFIRSYWSSPSEGSCVRVIEDAVTKYSLTIEAGEGGTTSPSPGTYTYNPESQVQVTAVPDSNCEFVKWTGDISSTQNPVTVTMDSDKTVKANFRPKPKLTIQSSQYGTTNPSPGDYYYATGAQVQVTAVPDTNCEFVNWTGSISSAQNPVTVTVDADKTIKANFRVKPKLTIQAGTGGTTNPSPGDYYYATGAQVQVSAIPDTYSIFISWSGSSTGSANPVSLTMDSDKSISAYFRYIYAPIATGRKVLNRTFSQAEYINILSWRTATANEGLDITKYRIYTMSGDTPTLLVELAGDKIEYYHRKAGQASIQYAIRAVTSSGREGAPALVTVQ